MLTTLKKTILRRIGKLVVKISDDGVEIKGFRRRRWKKVTWEQIASLADESEPIYRRDEQVRGSKNLKALIGQ